MNMPCRDAPEAWVGDDAQLRAQAAIECAGCDWLAECARESCSRSCGVKRGNQRKTAA